MRTRPPITWPRPWLAGVLAGLVAALALAAPATARPIPDPPSGEVYVLDLADLLPDGDRQRVQDMSREALERYNSPIAVVTITRMSDYGGRNIERFATRWFNEWGIGTMGLQGGTNQGILFLVSVVDRKARIELGGTWGRGWDKTADRIMQREVVPNFKKGDFAGGIVDGVEALLDMAKGGPDSRPPGDFLEDTVRPYCQMTLLSPGWFLAVTGLGVVLILASFFLPEHRGSLLMAGTILVVVGAFSYVLLILAAALGGGGKGGSSGSSSRGFSGGYSGGGGATGSW